MLEPVLGFKKIKISITNSSYCKLKRVPKEPYPIVILKFER